MGVSGFTTYMSEHFNLFHRSFRLENSFLVIDGNGIAISLYFWHTKSNDRFGGDYDNYADTVYRFFKLLKECQVTPIILFDGDYEDRKIETIFRRLKERIRSIKKLNDFPEENIELFPMFTCQVFRDIAISLGLKCIRTDYECDSEIGCLGRQLKCPILGYDSDFYFFGSPYIPFDTFRMESVAHNDESRTCGRYIPCHIYNVENFLECFRGLDRKKLPLLPVLLGNDYIERVKLIKFYDHMKIVLSQSKTYRQVLIQSVINWLQHETLESAISKTLEYLGGDRESTYIEIKNAMKGYQQVNSTITDCLKDTGITFSENEEPGKDIENNMESVYFVNRYRKCNLPGCFTNIKWRNTYFTISQIENFADPNSHRISLNILSSIHKILTSSAKIPFFCILRCGADLKRELVEEYKGNLPGLEDIPNLSDSQRKHCLLEILKIDETFLKFLNELPSNWHVFMISLCYWSQNSQKVIDVSYTCSLLLCAIILNFVDSNIGFCRSQEDLERILKNNNLLNFKCNKVDPSEPIIKTLLENVNFSESVMCLKSFLPFFTNKPKKSSDIRLDETTIVGYFSEFQSCALHIKFLNNLLCFPFEDLMFSKFFSGTFLYNIVLDFKNRSSLKSHLESLLKNCDNIFNALHFMMLYIKDY